MVPTIAIYNRSTVVTDADVRIAVAACQIQVGRDLFTAWGVRANLFMVPVKQAAPKGAWLVTIFDTSDQAGALGYHDVSGLDVPSGGVFAKSDKDNGLSWTVTLSHELVEMLCDPLANDVRFYQDGAATGTLVACEVCDAVEDDALGYAINGTAVSDFVTPAFFDVGRPGGQVYDQCRHLTGPLMIAPGGYMSVFSVRPDTTGWTQQFGPGGAGRRFAAGSGGLRRMARFGDDD